MKLDPVTGVQIRIGVMGAASEPADPGVTALCRRLDGRPLNAVSACSPARARDFRMNAFSEPRKSTGTSWASRQPPRWTHFDGYQIWKAGRLRALVGGDARYGGRHHICSIGCDDEREEVIVRLAVVQRERFVVTGRRPANLVRHGS